MQTFQGVCLCQVLVELTPQAANHTETPCPGVTPRLSMESYLEEFASHVNAFCLVSCVCVMKSPESAQVVAMFMFISVKPRAVEHVLLIPCKLQAQALASEVRSHGQTQRAFLQYFIAQ